MKRAFYLAVGLCVFALCTAPGWAAKGGHSRSGGHAAKTNAAASKSSMSTVRSNAGGKTRGIARAEEVQGLNKTADTNRGFTTAPGLANAEKHTAGKHGTAAPHPKGGKGKTHGHDKDEDESKE